MDHPTLALAAALLLAAPGPTNALLATSGALDGWKRTLPLLAAECAGYLVAIGALVAVVQPATDQLPWLGDVLRAVLAGYLAFAAWRLWKQGDATELTAAAVAPSHVFVTTLLNPKALVLAAIILAEQPAGSSLGAVLLASALPLLVAIVVTGAAWIAFGASLQRGTGHRLSTRACCRAGASVLLAFSIAVARPLAVVPFMAWAT